MTQVPSGRPLGPLVQAFVAEINQIEGVFATCVRAPTVTGFKVPYAPTEDGCLVSLWDAWSRFLRSVVLECASGPVMSLNGNRYIPTVRRSETQVFIDLESHPDAKVLFGMTNGEPNWHHSSSFQSVVDFLGLPNANLMTTAIGSTWITGRGGKVKNSIREIQACRNFVAHKSDYTLNRVSRYSSTPFVGLSAHMRTLTGKIERFSEWKNCLGSVAVSIVK